LDNNIKNGIAKTWYNINTMKHSHIHVNKKTTKIATAVLAMLMAITIFFSLQSYLTKQKNLRLLKTVGIGPIINSNSYSQIPLYSKIKMKYKLGEANDIKIFLYLMKDAMKHDNELTKHAIFSISSEHGTLYNIPFNKILDYAIKNNGAKDITININSNGLTFWIYKNSNKTLGFITVEGNISTIYYYFHLVPQNLDSSYFSFVEKIETFNFDDIKISINPSYFSSIMTIYVIDENNLYYAFLYPIKTQESLSPIEKISVKGFLHSMKPMVSLVSYK